MKSLRCYCEVCELLRESRPDERPVTYAEPLNRRRAAWAAFLAALSAPLRPVAGAILGLQPDERSDLPVRVEVVDETEGSE